MTLKIYSVALEMLGDVRPLADAIRRHDPDLARQLRRAASSVSLNIAEGAGTRGGLARARFETACGSVKEVRACLETARALGYMPPLDARTMDRLDHLAAATYRLAH